MNTALPISIAGTELLLLSDKAAYWPEHEMLLVADAHFGKAAAYRKLGQPVPQGTTRANLAKLDRLMERHACRQVVFLGDFLHAPGSHAEATLAALSAWRQQHADKRVVLIRGNHDERAGDPPAYLQIEVVTEPYLAGPFALRHTPAPHPTHHVLAGHLHPSFLLIGRGRQSMRLPCFCSDTQMTLFPAFGDFTGGMRIDPIPGRRIFVTHESGIWHVRT